MHFSCAKECVCENGATCDRFTGACRCAPGFTGPKCTQLCPSGRYGVGCREKCQCASTHSHCDPKSGVCRCGLGWRGPTCQQQCPPGKYGPDCILDCDCHGDASCDSVQGCCNCPKGRYGSKCQFCIIFFYYT